MKRTELNQRPDWTFWVPDNVANWDAIHNWERERLASMEAYLKPGDVLFDIGAEHGWLSAIYGTFVGHAQMVLVEPSPFFWPNIARVWYLNHFDTPRATYNAYAGASVNGEHPTGDPWPSATAGEECDAQAYVNLAHENLHNLSTITVDSMTERDTPRGITIDVEGAELLVLQGASETLRIDRPLVWVSVHDDLMARDYGHDPVALFDLMAEHRYDATLLAIDHEAHWLFTPKAHG